MADPYYLLGKGEKLTSPVDVPRGPSNPKPPYTFQQAKERLTPKVVATSRVLDSLPRVACPRDEAVAVLTLHPQYLAKSYYPAQLLSAVGLRTVGSRPVAVTPERWERKEGTQEAITAELFVAGPRQQFRLLAETLPQVTLRARGAEDLIKIEDFRVIPPSERIKGVRPDPESKSMSTLLEVVLHSGGDNPFILQGFQAFLESLNVEVNLDKRIDAGDLSFVPVRVPREKIERIAQFSFLRLARDMPRLRRFQPETGSILPGCAAFPVAMPTQGPLDPTIRVACFDGGVPDLDILKPWVHRPNLRSDTAAEDPQAVVHGLAVTSALLFGPIQPGQPLPVPYARVDHYRVVDVNTDRNEDDEGELYDVLRRIDRVLAIGHYNFVNISLGPDKPIDDDLVSPWTSKLDPYFASGDVLATISVGNSGEADAELRYNKIQPPSDCVNALSVGACDSLGDVWARAPYSSVGPGRSPGVIKPDVVAFGGSQDSPFWVLDGDSPGSVLAVKGTSFASPAGLRTAIGARAMLGPGLRPLTLKALLIHRSEEGPHLPSEIGWGRLRMDLGDLISSDPRTVHVVYQGMLDPKKYLILLR